MRGPQRRVEGGWSAEAAICCFAALLAFGTLAWMEALNVRVLTGEPVAGSAHFVRDGLLLLPLALAAAWWGMRPNGHRDRGLPRMAAASAAAFSVLLVPATAAHTALHDADATGVAHADGPGGTTALGVAQESHGLASALLHGATDAMLALPVAFLLSLGALALLRRRRARTSLPATPRRLVLTASTLVLAAAAAAFVPVSGAASPDYPKFSMPLTFPPVLTGQDIFLTMAETQQQILPTGPPTTMWTYNGSFPGPIIRRPSGVPTNVTVTNNLPASAGSMTMHHHGAQTTEESDGQPANYLIPTGASKTYTYPGIDNGAPERASPQWYHDHRDMVTGRNIWMGLAGAFIYDDPFEQGLNLPKGRYDLPLLVTDREFDANNQIPYTFLSGGVYGDVILVNGVPQPYYDVGDRRYRLRLYNVSNKRDYTFRLSNGQAMTQIGTDSGLLPEPVSRTSIRLGPAERADVVIDFAGHLNENIVLENGDAAFGPGDRDGEVMQFRVNQDVTDDSSPVPSTLRPLPQTGAPVITRTWNFDRTGGKWTINGLGFDPNRVDAVTTLGTTERWVFRNPSTQTHQVHVHLGDQKLVSRDGQPPAPFERLKDTWYLAPGEEVVVDVKFSDYVGKFILHCHVLEHEDDGMMTQFETVRGSDPGDPKPDATPPPSTLGDPLPGGGSTGDSGPKVKPPATFSNRIRILSSKRLKRILRGGLRFEAAVPAKRTTLRAALSAKGHGLGSVRRARLSRGRVKVTLKLSRSGRARLRRLLAHHRRVTTLLKVTAGNTSARAHVTIRR